MMPLPYLPWLRRVLQPALDRGGNTHSFEDIVSAIVSGDMQLWLAERGATVTQINTYPTGKRQLHVMLAGGEMDDVLGLLPPMEAFGKALNCNTISLTGRKGWQRILRGWSASAVIMEKPL